MAIDLARLTLAPAMRLFGAAVLYATPDAPGFVLRAVFDRAHVEVFSADGIPVSTIRAQLGVRMASFPAGIVPAQGDHVQVALFGARHVDHAAPPPAGVTLHDYLVQDVQPDAEGGAVLILSAA
jgi:hypothetical protein